MHRRTFWGWGGWGLKQGGGISDPAARLAIAGRVQESGDAQVIRGGDGRLLPLSHIFIFIYSADRDGRNSSDHHNICGRNENIFSYLCMIISVNHYFLVNF